MPSATRPDAENDLKDGTEEYVRTWLEKSGRALEMRVARTIRKIGDAVVVPSYSYVDVVTGQSREGDVLAKFEWTSVESVGCSITAAIECKSSRKHPWVAFYSDSLFPPREDLRDWATFAHGPFNGVTQQLPGRWIGREPFTRDDVATHVVAARSDDGADEKNPAGDAIRQVLSAASAIRAQYIDNQVRERVGLVCIPVIVTEAPLLTCQLSEDGEIALEKVRQFDVWGYDATGVRQRVYVRCENSLALLADQLRMRASEAGSE